MQEGCQIIGFDWRYLYVNDSAARHGRTTREALVGRTIMECYPGVEGTPLFQRLSACMTERTTQRLENEFVYPDGGRAWFDLVVMPSREGIFITSYDITTRKQAELEQRAAAARVVKQVEHLTLLDQLTRSIAERHDLGSICQAVVVRIEESLPVDVAGAFLYDEPRHVFRLNAVGARAAAASEAFLPGETIGIDANGLSRVLTGVVVYERDIADLDVPFARRLAATGCRSMVLAPMRSESRVLGLLVAARRAPDGFASTECEFLRQAAEHVALAVQHAELHTALRTAYDDLRQTQHSSMQLERMSAMAQMASGIAHDINNALSPVSLYAEVLLAQEHDLSARTREYLELIRHSVQGVAETVSRMREFARPQDRGRTPAPLRLNEIVQKAVTFTHARWGDLAQRQGVTIDVVTDLASGLPDVSGVESELRDALTNLIFNAIDAMPRGGTITLRTRLESPPGRGRSVVGHADGRGREPPVVFHLDVHDESPPPAADNSGARQHPSLGHRPQIVNREIGGRDFFAFIDARQDYKCRSCVDERCNRATMNDVMVLLQLSAHIEADSDVAAFQLAQFEAEKLCVSNFRKRVARASQAHIFFGICRVHSR